MPNNRALNQRKQARLKAGLTIREVSKRTRRSPSYIQRIESSGNAPFGIALRLAHLYGCRLELFF